MQVLNRVDGTFGAGGYSRALLDAGIPVAIGSDGPMNPFLNIMFATTHPNSPSEALTREQAVTAYTRGSAFAEFAEHDKVVSIGVLEHAGRDQLAEVVRAGIESVHPSQIASAQALALSRTQTMRHVVLPQVRFGDGRMEGFGGCNRINARFVNRRASAIILQRRCGTARSGIRTTPRSRRTAMRSRAS